MTGISSDAGRLWYRGRERRALELGEVLEEAGASGWQLELGFGKGRYLLEQARAAPDRKFLGIEIARHYYRLARDRAARRGLRNLLLVHGEALYLLDAVLPRGFASTIHVYFPDPWPKARHHKRRLFDAETVDVLLRCLEPGGELFFASDHVAYASRVEAILRAHPAVDVTRREGPWPDGARTNYEAKYEAEGRRITRLVVRRRPDGGCLLHPEGALGIVSALAPPRSSDTDQAEG